MLGGYVGFAVLLRQVQVVDFIENKPMGCRPFTVLLAALLVCVALDTQAQDQTWEQSIDLSRRAQASRDLDQAEQLLNLALARARGFATNDPRRVVSLMELAKLHLARGDYARPEQLYREADPIARQAWGSSSEEYADLLNEIGRYYHLRVRYEFAERFYRQCCSIRVQLLGREHADVAACLNNLAVLYENQSFYQKAETYYRSALVIREKQLGPDHTDTIITLEHFSRLLHKVSRADESTDYQERAQQFRSSQVQTENTVDLGVMPTGQQVQPAVLLERTEPEFTEEARLARQEGSVLLQADIDTEGVAQNIQVLRYLGLGLDEKAVEAVQQWRFRPARQNGRRIPSRIRLEIAFRLM